MTAPLESSEDYLEAIFAIRTERGRYRDVDIAERMGVTKPSVTKALATFSSRSLVEAVDCDVRLVQGAGNELRLLVGGIYLDYCNLYPYSRQISYPHSIVAAVHSVVSRVISSISCCFVSPCPNQSRISSWFEKVGE